MHQEQSTCKKEIWMDIYIYENVLGAFIDIACMCNTVLWPLLDTTFSSSQEHKKANNKPLHGENMWKILNDPYSQKGFLFFRTTKIEQQPDRKKTFSSTNFKTFEICAGDGCSACSLSLLFYGYRQSIFREFIWQ